MSSNSSIRVRFAPSPTGNVHIGNIRVCIYNWLFARNQGGTMLLRIEDTDTARSTPEAIENLFKALEWLGLDYDEEPVYQSKRLERYREAAQQLIESGHAYYSAKGDSEKGEALIFKVEEDSTVTDIILGERSKSAEDMADFVIMKSDNTPVFHLANVIDDMDQGVTHILRGNDHVENTFRHVLLYKALGAVPPKYAHFPMIVNQSGKPYSKRDGDAYVGDFREKGFLPEALFNFLALCGWSPGDDKEVMTREEMKELFLLERVRTSPAQFDMKKMIWMNKEHIKALPGEELISRVEPYASSAGCSLDSLQEQEKKELIELFRERIDTLADFPEKTSYIFNADFEYDEKGVRKFIEKEPGGDILLSLKTILHKAESYTEQNLEGPFKKLMEDKEVGFLKVAQPLRIALTGGTASPGIFELLEFLGRDEVLRRIDRTINELVKE